MKHIFFKAIYSFSLCVFTLFSFQMTHAQETFFGLSLGENTFLSSDILTVLEGQRSISAAYHGNDKYTQILHTDPASLRLLRDTTYIVSFRYRILEPSEKGFETLFYSQVGGSKGSWLPSHTFGGAVGDSGVINLKSTLGPYNDYQFVMNIIGKGAIAIDSFILKETQEAKTILSEDFEAPELLHGQFSFDLDPPVSYPLGSENLFYTLRSTKGKDLDGDGHLESVLTITTYPTQEMQPIIILGNKGQVSNLTSTFFPKNVPELRHSPHTYFADLDQDGRDDLIFTEAGLDVPPWTGSRIVVALRTADGSFKDVSDRIPHDLWNTRSYMVGVGDLNRNGVADILLPDQLQDSRTTILTWVKDGFKEKRDWIDKELWGFPGRLSSSNHLEIADFDGDKYGDIFFGGDWSIPSSRIAFGSAKGFLPENILVLPDGVFGHTAWEESEQRVAYQGGSCIGALVIDLDNDGKKDLFEVQEQIIGFKRGFTVGDNRTDLGKIKTNGGSTGAACSIQVFMNKGKRRFEEMKPEKAGEFLSWRHYISLLPQDLNNDGFMDIVGGYWARSTPPRIDNINGTTFFINDGTGYFRVVEGFEILPTASDAESKMQGQLGMFMPTMLSQEGMEGLFIYSWSDYKSGILVARRGVTTSSFGTGPDFQNSAKLGYPGFNEDYYLRNYSDARSAVLAGMFSSGLEHYRHLGIPRGYKAFAANATVVGTNEIDTLHLGIKSADARITALKEGYSINDLSGKYGTITLINIETLAFMDGSTNLSSK